LAATATLEDVAALLWNCDGRALLRQHDVQPCAGRVDAGLPMPQRLRMRFEPLASRWALQGVPAGEHGAHWPLVQAMLQAATGCAVSSAPVHEQLAAAWGLSAGAADELRRALVLVADHELNVSSFTARCVASTGADAAAALAAALAALSGPRHGAMSIEVEALWPQFETASRNAARLERWLDRQSRVPGFGHALYPDGDPRAQALLARLPRHTARDRLVQAMQRRSGQAPNLDFGLVALTRELAAPEGAAFALFAIGRSVGWLAHVFEQQAQGALIRPRAAYVGAMPQPPVLPAPIGRVIRRR
jgi:citrate synthase